MVQLVLLELNMSKLIDILGQRFGRLLVIGIGGKQHTTPLWSCLCDCGKTVLASGAALRTGRQQSCGCFRTDKLRAKNSTHGKCDSTEYWIWCGMKDRCNNKNHIGYQNYGGRGIKVCDEWLHSFETFLKDMGPRPSKDHSLDRYPNSDGNYEPSNCRWATGIEQHSNTRKNVVVMDGSESITVMEWARRHGVSPQTVYGRIQRGQPFDQKGKPGPRSKA